MQTKHRLCGGRNEHCSQHRFLKGIPGPVCNKHQSPLLARPLFYTLPRPLSWGKRCQQHRRQTDRQTIFTWAFKKGSQSTKQRQPQWETLPRLPASESTNKLTLRLPFSCFSPLSPSFGQRKGVILTENPPAAAAQLWLWVVTRTSVKTA